MRLIFLCIALFLSIIFSCKNKTATVTSTTDSSAGNEPFYPITQYIESQIAYVDSMPLAIEKQTFINNHRVDSTIISRTAFKQLAMDFMQPDINLPSEKPLYREAKFQDLTINTLTFSYSANNPSSPFQQRDILLDPTTQRVRTVLFRKIEQHADTTITINGLWKHNMNFQLSYIIEPKDGPMQTKEVKVIWDRPFVSEREP